MDWTQARNKPSVPDRPETHQVEVLLDRAQAFLAAGRAEQAVVFARDALGLEPDSAEVLMALAVALAADPDGDDDEALRCARRATQQDPEAAGLWQALSEITRAQGLHDEAVQAAWRSVRLDPARSAAHRQLALVGAAAIESDRAAYQRLHATTLGAARQAVRLDPQDSDNHVVLAWVCHLCQDHLGADIALREATRLAPDSADVQTVRGLINLNNAHVDEADRAFRSVLRRDPTAADVRLKVEAVTETGVLMTVVPVGFMSVVTTGWVVVARGLLPATDWGWVGSGRAVALVAWVVAAAASVGLVRYAVRRYGARALRRGSSAEVVVVAAVVGLINLVGALAPLVFPVTLLMIPLVLLTLFQLATVRGFFRARSEIAQRRRRAWQV